MYTVIHDGTGEEVIGDFLSEAEAFAWLKAACDKKEIQPDNIQEYSISRPSEIELLEKALEEPKQRRRNRRGEDD